MAKTKKKQVSDLIKTAFPQANGMADALSEDIAEIYKKKHRNIETDLHNLCKAWFINFCDKEDKECVWSYQHSNSLNLLIKKLKQSIQKKMNHAATDTDVYNSFQVIMERLPEWYMEHLQLSTIVNSYDKIINEIKSKPKTENKNADQLKRVINGEL